MTDRQDVLRSARYLDMHDRSKRMYWKMMANNLDDNRLLDAARSARLAVRFSASHFLASAHFVHDYTATEAYRLYPLTEHHGKLLEVAGVIIDDGAARLPEPTVWGELPDTDS